MAALKNISVDRYTYADIEEFENEERNKPLALLERIDRIVKIHSFIKNSNENNVNYQKTLDEHLAVCSGLLGITALQTLIFTYILNSGSLSLVNLAKLLKVTRVQCFKHLDDLDVLLDKRLIRKLYRKKETKPEYWIPYEVIQSLREGKVFAPPRYCDLSNARFFKYLDKILSALSHTDQFHSKSSKKILMMDFFNLLEDNPQLEFVKKIKSLSLTEASMILLSCLCTEFYIDREDAHHHRNIYLSEYFGSENDLDILQQLFKLGLIEYYRGDLKNKGIIVLTNKAIIELLGIDEDLHKQGSNLDIINHENIVQKELFYNASEGRLVEQLTDLLCEKNYNNVTERLESKGMRTGFNCLFFGVPGTGKTETVYQIAHKSGRDIMPINILATKGRSLSEIKKNIRHIFSEYRHKVKNAKNKNTPAPILLLYGVDAIINKRKNISTSTVVQPENIIQNIILEEMEKLNGILIAITNLTKNFDTAFELRFIYKIEFHKPDIEIRRLIWKSLIPELTDEESIKLAEACDLSGGQIENIARKWTIMGTLNGKDSDLAELLSFCNEESIFKKDPKIGF